MSCFETYSQLNWMGFSPTFEWFSQQHSGQGTLHCLLKLCNSPWDFRVPDPCGATERTRLLLSAQSGDGGVCWVFFHGYAVAPWFCTFNKHKEVPSLTMWNYGPPANRWMERNGPKWLKFVWDKMIEMFCFKHHGPKTTPAPGFPTHSNNKFWSRKDWVKVFRIGLPTLLLIIALCNYG